MPSDLLLGLGGGSGRGFSGVICTPESLLLLSVVWLSLE